VAAADRPSIAVRSATPDDAVAIARVHVLSWQAAYRGLIPDPILDQLSIARRTEFWRGVIDGRGDDHVFVADVDGVVAGFASTGPARDDDLATGAGAGAGELYAIYLLPEAWSFGAGRAMLDAASADLAARGFRLLVLWVLTDNARGRRFYEAAGWRPDGASRMLDFGGTPIQEMRYRATPPARSEV
jgi:GNAT superfamily N-acetyltransferase